MNIKSLKLKYIALKICLLDSKQTDLLLSEVGRNNQLISCLKEIHSLFPQLRSLSPAQKEAVFKELERISDIKDEWLVIRKRIDSMRADGYVVPEKLYSLIGGQREGL